MKILLTGFEPFGSLKVNPSQVIIERISCPQTINIFHDIYAEILPVKFGPAEAKIKYLIQELEPQLILCLGVSAGNNAITLERIARNIDFVNLHKTKDIKNPKIVCNDSPLSYKSNLPLKELCRFLENRNIPVIISDDAGKFVCNHVFYVALHETRLLGNKAKVGFIHVPLMTEQILQPSLDVPSLPLTVMVYAIQTCIEFITQL